MEKKSNPAHAYHDGFPLSEDEKISWIHRAARTRLGVVLFVFVVIACSCLPACFYPTTLLFILNTGLLVGHVKMRRFADFVVGSWIYALAYGIGTVFGVRVRVFGHSQKFSDRCLIILNHRCHFDWLYFWMVVAQRGDVDKWSVMMKSAGKYVPFLGWAMQCRNYFFLSRHWEQDVKELSWKLNYLRATDSPYQILMFPEGTDFTPRSKVKSDAYAEANGLPKLDYTLHPKSRGFVYTLKGLREYNIDAVYDMTVGYPDNFVKTEADLLSKCKLPREIHYHVTRYDAASIPQSDEGIENWLRERWIEKDKRLKHFYANREFPNSDTISISNGGSKTPNKLPECASSLSFWTFFYRQCLYSGVTIAVYYLCTLHWLFVLYIAVAASVTIYRTHCTEGVDFWVMKHLKKEMGEYVHDFDSKANGGSNYVKEQ